VGWSEEGTAAPLNIALADSKLLSMAGLFNYWKPANSQGRPMLPFTVVTTAPKPLDGEDSQSNASDPSG
jgi:putative SOS response-associated peptidase YedK